MRQVHEGDVARLLKIFGDPDVVRFMAEADEPLIRHEDAYTIYDWTCRVFEAHTGIRWALTLRGDPSDTLIGTARFSPVQRQVPQCGSRL